MSWQIYVDRNMVATGRVKHGCICGINGALSAKSPDWDVTQEELSKLAGDFGSAEKLAMNGITLGGVRYIYLSGDENIARGKKDKGGVHIAKTNSVFLIAQYDEPTQPNACAKIVEDLADYLIEQNS